MPQLMLRVADVEALAAARPDDDALAALGERDGWLGVSLYVIADAADGRVSAHVRHFAPLLGVPEDPVTGSAGAALGACLASAGMADGEGNLAMRVTPGRAAGARRGDGRPGCRAGIPGNPTSRSAGGWFRCSRDVSSTPDARAGGRGR